MLEKEKRGGQEDRIVSGSALLLGEIKETQGEGDRISNDLFFFLFNFWDTVFKGLESKVKCGKLGFSLPFRKAFATFPPQRSSDLRVAVESRQKVLLSRSFLFYCIFQLRVLLAHSNRTKQPPQKNTEKNNVTRWN